MNNDISRIIGIEEKQQIEALKSFVNKEGVEKRKIFQNSLMFLAADIIKSDDEIKPIEIQRVKDLLSNILEEEEAKETSAVFFESLNAKDSTYELNWQEELITHCNNLKEAMTEEELLHILAFLYSLIKVDGVVDACEMISLMGISQLMGVNLSNNPQT